MNTRDYARNLLAGLEGGLTTHEAMTNADGVPCKHQGCLHHVTHPCEGCGRVAGRSLLPCPFRCGGEVRLEMDGGTWYLRHGTNDPDCLLDIQESSKDINELIDAWNKREYNEN